MSLLHIFFYLQLLDVFTTLVGFRVGAAEASPFVAKLIHVSSPLLGLLASKVLAIAIAGVCLYTSRRKLINWINYWYAGLVVWNLLIILASLNHHVQA